MTIAEMWRQEGLQQALQHYRQQFLRLLRQRHGQVSEAIATRVDSASQEDIDTWMSRLLSAGSIDAVFQKD